MDDDNEKEEEEKKYYIYLLYDQYTCLLDYKRGRGRD